MIGSEKDVLFREPGGIRESLVWVGLGLLLIGLAVFGRLLVEASIINLVTGTICVSFAIAESLPSRHRKLAGVIRAVGLGVLFVVLGYVFYWISTMP